MRRLLLVLTVVGSTLFHGCRGDQWTVRQDPGSAPPVGLLERYPKGWERPGVYIPSVLALPPSSGFAAGIGSTGLFVREIRVTLP